MKKLFLTLLLLCSPALAQDGTNHSVPINGGPGVSGFREAGPCSANQALVWAGSTVDPTCTAILTGSLPVTVPNGGTGGVSWTANLPLIGNGTGALAQGTRSGNTTAFVTTTGTQTSGNCVSIDANGNHIASGTAGCGGGVTSWNGRTGVVVPLINDYTANQITPKGIFNIDYYGALADARHLTGNITNGLTTFTGSGFTSADCQSGGGCSGTVNKVIAIQGAAAAGATLTTTITNFTNSTTVTVALAASATVTGAETDMGTNNTTAIQSAVTAACVAGGTILVGPGAYLFSSLNIANCVQGPVLAGVGNTVNASRLVPSTDGVIALDFTGTQGWKIQGLQIGRFDLAARPIAAIVAAPSTVVTGIDMIQISNIYIAGRYSKTTVYLDRIASSNCQKSAFWQYNNVAGDYALSLTNNNVLAISSTYVTTYGTAGTISDISLVGCEAHAHVNAGASADAAIQLDGATNIQWFGGNVSGSGSSLIVVTQDNSIHPSNLMFSGTTFYSENGTPFTNVFGGAGNIAGICLPQISLQSGTTLFAHSGSLSAGSCGYSMPAKSRPIDADFLVQNTTNYVGPAGHNTGTEVRASWTAPQRGYVYALYGNHSASPGGVQTFTVTANKNGAAQASTYSITGAAVVGSDTTHWFVVAANDTLSITDTLSATANGHWFSGSLGFLPF